MQQSTEPPNRTETEGHWDQICLGLTAAGTVLRLPRKVMKVTSRTPETAEEKQANRDGWWKRTRRYVSKHRGMAKIGLVIGGGFATPFIVASLPAISQGAGRDAAAWLGSAFLMFATAMTIALWSSRRD